MVSSAERRRMNPIICSFTGVFSSLSMNGIWHGIGEKSHVTPSEIKITPVYKRSQQSPTFDISYTFLYTTLWLARSIFNTHSLERAQCY